MPQAMDLPIANCVIGRLYKDFTQYSENYSYLCITMIDKEIEIEGIHFGQILSASDIDKAVSDVAERINADYAGREIMFVVILKGAFMFAADLLRKIKGLHRVCFVRYSSYRGMESSGSLKEIMGLTEEMEGKDVIIVEDIVDSGFTMGELMKEMKMRHVHSCEICTFAFKPANFQGDYRVKYVGKAIDNDFIVGYGLDLNEQGRTLGEIYQRIENKTYKQ